MTALEQQRSQTGWGLTTTQAMSKGETLISLPPHLPLNIQPSDSYLLDLSRRIPGMVLTAFLIVVFLKTKKICTVFSAPMIRKMKSFLEKS